MRREDLYIAEPCDANWEEMTGDEQRRFCSLCSKHVHDLSQMTEKRAEVLIRTATETPCVRYSTEATGRVLHRPSRRALMAAGFAVMVGFSADSAYANTTPEEEPSTLKRVVEKLRAWWNDEGEGCTKSPFQTTGEPMRVRDTGQHLPELNIEQPPTGIAELQQPVPVSPIRKTAGKPIIQVKGEVAPPKVEQRKGKVKR